MASSGWMGHWPFSWLNIFFNTSTVFVALVIVNKQWLWTFEAAGFISNCCRIIGSIQDEYISALRKLDSPWKFSNCERISRHPKPSTEFSSGELGARRRHSEPVSSGRSASLLCFMHVNRRWRQTHSLCSYMCDANTLNLCLFGSVGLAETKVQGLLYLAHRDWNMQQSSDEEPSETVEDSPADVGLMFCLRLTFSVHPAALRPPAEIFIHTFHCFHLMFMTAATVATVATVAMLPLVWV